MTVILHFFRKTALFFSFDEKEEPFAIYTNGGHGALPSFLQEEELKDQNSDVSVAFLVICPL